MMMTNQSMNQSITQSIVYCFMDNSDNIARYMYTAAAMKLGRKMRSALNVASTVRTLDLRSFNSHSDRYQVITTWMGDCLLTGKPFWYITNHQGQLSLQSLRGR